MMERQLEQMVHLIDDLLDLSRISCGKIDLRKERIDLATAIQQAIEASRPLIAQADHELLINFLPGPIHVDADPTRLAQVFANLLNNAAKFTDRGGQIRLNMQRLGAEAVVSIQDNGIGIPIGMLPHVFEMFTQVDSNLERSHGGLGIGLSIVKRLVEMHGGSVEARSNGQGRGSEFVVRLPVALSVTGDEPTNQRDPVYPTTRHRILVVDDNVDAADLLSQLLEVLGNEVITFYDAESGIRAARKFRPGILLCDIGMPKMNGYDLARSIRAEAWGKNTVLVALTGYGQMDDLQRSADAGFDHHFVKPLGVDDLMALLAGLQPQPA
jgi:CheY-like chemotaxis protein